MKYNDNGKDIRICDHVYVEDAARGIVVCDFEHQECLSGYEDWLVLDRNSLIKELPKNGILVETKKYGLIHYEIQDNSIKRFPRLF